MSTSTNDTEVVIDYDSQSLEEYVSKWNLPMGRDEMAVNSTRKVTDGVFSVRAVAVRDGADAINDHAKYSAVSHESFPMPKNGSLQFSVDIQATTPGAQPGRVIHGSHADSPNGRSPYAQSTIEGQQEAVTFEMTNVETGQVFDWFVSGTSAFAVIERLPSSITHPTMAASDSNFVGLDRAYTQIVKSAPLKPGKTHTFAIRYTRSATESSVEYFLDADLVVHVDHIGIPLDTQGAPYTGVYPSFHCAPGEEVKQRMDTFVIGHGLYSMLDSFPFQPPGAPDRAVPIPVAESVLAQGAKGEFSKFEVTTVSNRLARTT
jgi:hypothetical protein